MSAFQKPGERYKKDMVDPYGTSHDLTQMVWAGFSKHQRWPLLEMTRDYRVVNGRERSGYTHQSYIWILEQVLPDYYEPEAPFMQDNAPIHAAAALRDWFEYNGVNVQDWPPYSPDLNPIENLWAILKAKVFERHPYLGPGKGAADLEQLIDAIKESWDVIEDEVLEELINSMPRRIAAIIDAEGWYTKY